MNEHDEARLLANRVLDRVNGDPDDDLAVLARQLLRADERLSPPQDVAGLVGELRGLAAVVPVTPSRDTCNKAADALLSLSATVAEPIPVNPLDGCPHCGWIEGRGEKFLDDSKLCAVHQKLQDLQEDLALERRVNKDTQRNMTEIFEALGIGPEDDHVAMAKERMGEIAALDATVAEQAERMREMEAKFEDADDLALMRKTRE